MELRETPREFLLELADVSIIVQWSNAECKVLCKKFRRTQCVWNPDFIVSLTNETLLSRFL